MLKLDCFALILVTVSSHFQRGYTFVAEARTPNAILPPGKFRLRVIGSTEPLPYPGREGVNSHFVNKEIRDYYIPNKYNIIFRCGVAYLF